jgi:hypothetical protein
MTFRSYLVFMAILTLIDWGAWLYILETVNPNETTIVGVLIFFVTLFLGLVGVVSIIESIVRVLLLKREVVIREVAIAFRHGVLLSLVAVGSILLLKQQLFQWWTLLILIVIASIFEYLSLVIQVRRR